MSGQTTIPLEVLLDLKDFRKRLFEGFELTRTTGIETGFVVWDLREPEDINGDGNTSHSNLKYLHVSNLYRGNERSIDLPAKKYKMPKSWQGIAQAIRSELRRAYDSDELTPSDDELIDEDCDQVAHIHFHPRSVYESDSDDVNDLTTILFPPASGNDLLVLNRIRRANISINPYALVGEILPNGSMLVTAYQESGTRPRKQETILKYYGQGEKYALNSLGLSVYKGTVRRPTDLWNMTSFCTNGQLLNSR